ncbi:hypothetical protein B4Q13_21110 [Lacticaseibacillus rhamnosus]
MAGSFDAAPRTAVARDWLGRAGGVPGGPDVDGYAAAPGREYVRDHGGQFAGHGNQGSRRGKKVWKSLAELRQGDYVAVQSSELTLQTKPQIEWDELS